MHSDAVHRHRPSAVRDDKPTVGTRRSRRLATRAQIDIICAPRRRPSGGFPTGGM